MIDNYVETSIVRISNQYSTPQHCNNSITRSSNTCSVDDDKEVLAFKSNNLRKNKSTVFKDCRKFISNSVESQTDQMKACEAQTNNHEYSRSDPPPLAFYPKNNGKIQKPIIISATQPPPLIPIERNFI